MEFTIITWLMYGAAYLVVSKLMMMIPVKSARAVLLSILNCGATYYLFFELPGVSLVAFLAYLGFVFFFGVLIKLFVNKDGWLYLLAVLPPVIWLVVFKIEMWLPLIGISFMSFRLLSLVHEQTKREGPALEFKHLLGFAFFTPTFLVGPISPYSYYVSSIDSPTYNFPGFLDNLLRIVVGLVKFTFLANIALNVGIEAVLKDGHNHYWWEFFPTAIFSFIYLYLNFSGINDIGIAMSNIIKVRVKENFDEPFKSLNIQDFWSRWHISLSELVRDVFFIPLNLFLARRIRFLPMPVLSSIALLVSFIVLGLWHEFSVRYLAFGIFHGLGVILSIYVLLPIQQPFVDSQNAYVRSVAVFLSRALVILIVALISSMAVINPNDYGFIFGRVLGII